VSVSRCPGNPEVVQFPLALARSSLAERILRLPRDCGREERVAKMVAQGEPPTVPGSLKTISFEHHAGDEVQL